MRVIVVLIMTTKNKNIIQFSIQEKGLSEYTRTSILDAVVEVVVFIFYNLKARL